MTTTSKFASKTSATAARNAEVLKTIRAKADAPKVRRTKTAAAAEQVAAPIVTDDVKAETPFEAFMRRTADARDEFMASQNVPTATRTIVATIAHLLSLSVTLYWGIEATTALMAAAFLLTSSVFVTWVIGFMGLVLAFYAALQTGNAIGQFVLNFDYDRTAAIGRDLRVAAAKRISLVKGWFTRATPEEVAA